MNTDYLAVRTNLIERRKNKTFSVLLFVQNTKVFYQYSNRAV